jgi:ubiquinone/menaquinone biosynthesis C-methylase UbiE
MARDRDREAFDERSAGYETGWRGDLHHRIADRTVDIAMASGPPPLHILDVGCGTGYLLRQLAERCPEAVGLVGIDPAPGMIAEAKVAATENVRLGFSTGVAEHLPFSEGTFDLIVSITSFDHWADQRAGLAECVRVMAPGGHLVLTDRFSAVLLPTLLAGHRGRARTVRQASRLLTAAGFHSIRWHQLRGITILAGLLIRTVTATK